MIPITMCHGIGGNLTLDRYDTYFKIASDLGFHTITYDTLAAWRFNDATMPSRPIMFDFDHPVRSIHRDIQPVMAKHGFVGNLFINTAPMEAMYADGKQNEDDRDHMTWDEIGELVSHGWHIGAHTHTHPNLSELVADDPTGEKIQGELETNDAIIEKHLGIKPNDFAFTGTSWSSVAEAAVKQRYRFGRLWIVGSEYKADGKAVRYADLVGVAGIDEADGGPPKAARYITRETDPYRLPSMELSRLIHEDDAYRDYLKHAIANRKK